MPTLMASPERKTPCQRTAHGVGVTISLDPLPWAGVVIILRRGGMQIITGDNGEQAHRGGAIDQLQTEAGAPCYPSLR